VETLALGRKIVTVVTDAIMLGKQDSAGAGSAGLRARRLTDTGAMAAAVYKIIAANPGEAEKAHANPKLAGWFVGQVKKATGGKANPAMVNDLVVARAGP
jgi:Asp-tRNA(Asn)/Glu-tRNA(Gln) amidotransferase B subunit